MTWKATKPSTIAAPMAPKPKIANVIRKAVDRKILASGVTDHISGAANGVYELRVKIAVDLGPEPRDVHVDDVGLRIEMVIPDVFEQHGAGDHLSGVLHQ